MTQPRSINVNLPTTFTFRIEGIMTAASLADALTAMELKMSQLSDKLDAVKAAVDAAAARVSEDVGELQRQIADLKDKVAQGSATAEDFVKIDAILDGLAKLDPLPDFPGAPAAVPAPPAA